MENYRKENKKDFYATCNGAEVVETKNYFYKRVNMFGDKELRLWKKSGRISTVADKKQFTSNNLDNTLCRNGKDIDKCDCC